MRRHAAVIFLLAAAAVLLAACGGGGDSSSSSATATSPSTSSTTATTTSAQGGGSSATFSDPSEITNPYLPVSRFPHCVLAGTDEGPNTRVVRDLLSRTEPFSYKGEAVDAAVVADRVTAQGSLVEKTLDYFAQDDAGTVYYFGEDVNEYKNGQLAGHSGQWRLGRDTQKPGVLMPADPRVGDTFSSEDVPGVTHETDHVVAAGKTQAIGSRTYHDVIRVRENAKPPPEVEYKTYARGTGVITEANGKLHLVACR